MALPTAFNGPGRLYVTIAAGTPAEYHCELTGAYLEPTSEVLSVETPCGNINIAKKTKWALNVAHVQDVSAGTTLTRTTFASDTSLADFLFVPDGTAKEEISATAPGYEGVCRIVAGRIGASITEVAVANPVWPVDGTPVEVTAPPAPLAARTSGKKAPATAGA